MSTTQPIRTREELQKFECFYNDSSPLHKRNYLMIIMGLNTALRITDILSLHWEAVYDSQKQALREHIELTEQKTGKNTMIALNDVLKAALLSWFEVKRPNPQDYIFESMRGKKAIDRCQAYRIVRKAAAETGLSKHISCHSLRKTFGYHAWKQGIPPAILMNIYNHSSYQITRQYLCIDQDDKDNVFYQVQL